MNVKTKYVQKTKLYHMHIYSFIVYIKTDDILKDIAEYIEIWFDISNCELNRPLAKGKRKKSNQINERWIVRELMIEFAGLKIKSYSYLLYYGNQDKKSNGTKGWVIKRIL